MPSGYKRGHILRTKIFVDRYCRLGISHHRLSRANLKGAQSGAGTHIAYTIIFTLYTISQSEIATVIRKFAP